MKTQFLQFRVQQPMRIISFLNLYFLVLLLSEFELSDSSESKFESEDYYILETPGVCGKEYSLDTSSSEQNSKTVFRTGESETVKCDGTGKPWNFDHENYPDLFMIYPQPVRECKSDGTWSSPIPICVKKDRNPFSKSKIEPSSKLSVDCFSADCLPQQQWERIGQTHRSCETKDKHINVEDRYVKRNEMIYSFNRPYYFSFILLRNTPDILSFELFAKKESILRDISEEAQNFLLEDYEASHADYHQDEKGCPLISIPVFTDQLRIHYSVYSNRSEKTYSTSGHAATIIEFHRVFTCHESEVDCAVGHKMDQCPKLPVIPNSREEFIKQGPVNGSMEYICKSGYQMRDPITNNQSDGVIRCIDGAWSPYPYPVCKPLGKPLVMNSKDDVSIATESNKHKIRRQDLTNTGTFTLITHEVGETNVVSNPAKEEQVEMPVQFDLTFVITVFSLVVLGSVSGSVLMIICIKLIRRHFRSKEIRNEAQISSVVVEDTPASLAYSEDHSCDSDFSYSGSSSVASSRFGLAASNHVYECPLLFHAESLVQVQNNC